MENNEAVEILKDILNESPSEGLTIWKKKEAIQTLLSLAHLFLSVKEVPQKYGYLHSKEGCKCESCKIVDIKNHCHDEFTAWLVGRVDKLEDTIIDFMRINKDGEKGFIGNLKPVGVEDISRLSQAIITYLTGGKNE